MLLPRYIAHTCYIARPLVATHIEDALVVDGAGPPQPAPSSSSELASLAGDGEELLLPRWLPFPAAVSTSGLLLALLRALLLVDTTTSDSMSASSHLFEDHRCRCRDLGPRGQEWSQR